MMIKPMTCSIVPLVYNPSIADCTVVIPTYNERENIELLLTRILEYPRFRVLVVDDNSPDGTGRHVAALAQQEHASPCCHDQESEDWGRPM